MPFLVQKFFRKVRFIRFVCALVILFSCFSSLITPASALPLSDQNEIYQFENISTEQGLSQSTVTSILQDRQGFMWFGTEGGLNKYDGYQFTVYKHTADNPGSLSSSVITSIFEDLDGNLWIGTLAGLDRLDRSTGSFVHAPQEFSSSSPVGDYPIYAIGQDNAGTLWAGTDGHGVVALDLKTRRASVYTHDPKNLQSLSNDTVRCILRDKSGRVWMGTDNGLNLFEPATKTFAHPELNSENLRALISNPIYSIRENEQGRLWFGTQKGVFLWDPATDKTASFFADPNIPGSLSDSSIRSVYTDSQGTLWIGTRSGLNVLKGAQEGFVQYRHDPNDRQSLISDSIRSIFEDRAGVMWIGSAGGGLSKYARSSHKFNLYRYRPGVSNSLSDNNVWSVEEGKNGTLWVGTFSSGLDRLDRRANTVTVYKNDPADPNSLGANDIRALLEDHNGMLWIGTEHGGLDRFDPLANKFTHYRHSTANPGSLSSDSVFSIFEDRDGNLWVGTQEGGLDRFNPQTGSFTHFRNDPQNPASLSNDEVRIIYQDHAGVLWIGTFGGLSQFDEKTSQFTSYRSHANGLSSDLVVSLLEYPAGVLWIGTIGGGLNRFDQATDSFASYSEQNGLPDDTIYGILAGSDGYLWLSTNRGISKFDPEVGTFRNYDASDGLQGNQFNPGAFLQGSGGELFFGGTQGLNSFFPQQILDNPFPPPLAVTSFKKFNQTVQTDLGSDQAISLSYRDNYISFEFAALDFNAPDKNQYAYKLDGFDQDWIQAGTRHYASYTNLPGGKYLFRVKGSNSDGIWNETGIAISISVTPPFWQTWWFMASIVVLLGAVLTGGFRWRLNSIRKQNLRLEAEITSRTSELSAANQQLEKEVEQRKRAEAELEKWAANELDQSEARFKAMFDNTSVGIALTGLDRRILQVNEAAARITGYPLEELVKLNPVDMALPEDQHVGDDVLKDMILGKRDSMTVERRYLRKNGEVFWGRVTYSLVRGPDHQPVYLIGLIEDINEQKLAAQKLAEQEAEYRRTLEQKVQERTHELSETNLRLVNEIEYRHKAEEALASKAAEEAIVAERTRLARDLHDAVTQTLFSASLIAEVLPDLWNMDAEEGRKSTEELRQLTRGALAEMRTLLLELRPAALTQARFPDLLKQLSEAVIGRARLPVKLEVKGDYEMPPEIKVAFYRIAQESLNNVVKYARATQVEILLNQECCDVHLEVRDNGIGFDPASIKPTSLGMRIMRERAEAIQAHFKVSSSPGQGTTVSLNWNEEEVIPISKIDIRGKS